MLIVYACIDTVLDALSMHPIGDRCRQLPEASCIMLDVSTNIYQKRTPG